MEKFKEGDRVRLNYTGEYMGYSATVLSSRSLEGGQYVYQVAVEDGSANYCVAESELELLEPVTHLRFTVGDKVTVVGKGLGFKGRTGVVDAVRADAYYPYTVLLFSDGGNVKGVFPYADQELELTGEPECPAPLTRPVSKTEVGTVTALSKTFKVYLVMEEVV